MKRVLTVAIAATLAALAWAQPKIAVLDAVIPKNMDPSVIVPVTDKITEALVGSGRFTVLDRDNIDSVLKEREFQLSDMVSDQDAATAGKYLGADFVVVVKVQKLSDTYYVSGKMITVQSGVIAKQGSAHAEGDIATLIDLSEQVGSVLSGSAALGQAPKDVNQGGAKSSAKDQSAPAPAKEVSKAPATRDTTVRPKKTWPLWLNLVPGFGLGSFIQGDAAGGWVGLLGCVGGELLYYAGYATYINYTSSSSYYSSSSDNGSGLMLAGSAVVVGTMIYGIFRPISYAKKWNRDHGVGSIEFLPTVVASTGAGGEVSAAPGAVLKLSY